MKQIFILISILLLSALVFAEEPKEKQDVKYEMTISVTYNAVTPEEAIRLTQEVIMAHSKACKVNVSTKKNGANGNEALTFTSPGNIYIDDGTSFITTIE